jgi:hypothetical protein
VIAPAAVTCPDERAVGHGGEAVEHASGLVTPSGADADDTVTNPVLGPGSGREHEVACPHWGAVDRGAINHGRRGYGAREQPVPDPDNGGSRLVGCRV